MKRTTVPGAAGLVAMLLFGNACGSGGPDRGAVLSDLADAAVVPGYIAFEVQATELAGATRELCASPDEGRVGATREALEATRDAWLSTEAFWVGPVMERRSWALVDWPVAADEIDALVDDESVVLDIDRLARRIGADQRGLQAVEFVLGPPEESPLDALAEPRRCAYLMGVTEVIADEAAALTGGWSVSFEGGPPYREAFVDPATGDLDALVNDALFLLEAITDAELGKALGLMEGDAEPAALTEGPAGLGVPDILSRTAALRAVLVGGGREGNEGIGPLLSDDLVDRLTAALDRADEAFRDLDGPLRERIADSAATAVEGRDALKEVQVLVSTEVVSALGVTIGFSDADGDSG